MSDVITELANEANDKAAEIARLKAENAKLRELATYALRYIERERCDDPKHELWHGKPCESCAEAGSSDCPKIMAKMFGELGIEAEQ